MKPKAVRVFAQPACTSVTWARCTLESKRAQIGIVSTKIASAKGLLNWNATQLCQCTSVVFRLSSLQDLLCSLAPCLIRSLYCISSSGNEGPILITSAPPPRHHGDDISSPPIPHLITPAIKISPPWLITGCKTGPQHLAGQNSSGL